MNVSLPARALVLAVFACLLLTAPAPAAWPGKNGAIAFSRNGNNGAQPAEIWVQLPSGKQRRLTSSEMSEGEPTYSADGRLIAFVRYTGAGADLWVMNSDGTDKRLVVDAEERRFAAEPAFLPSGRSLVFSYSGFSGGSKVFSVRVDGTGLKEQANRAKFPAVSPDGRWLAFWRHPGGDRLRLKNLRSGEERQVPSGLGYAPDFSPDGRRLVYVGKRPCGPKGQLRQMLMTIGLEDRHPRMLLNTCRLSFVPYGPVWSPQGDRIVFTRRETPRIATDVRLQMLNLAGALVPGAPRHQADAFEGAPDWQPLPGGTR